VTKFLAVIPLLLGSLIASAGPSVMPGSINFNSPKVWNKHVQHGLSDNGTYTGETRWYTTEDAPSGADILRYPGTSKGYLKVITGCAHRSLMPLSMHETAMPLASNGRDIPKAGIYIDSDLVIDADDSADDKITSPKDKINFWLYVSEDLSVTNFMVTAGFINEDSTISVKSYRTDAYVVPNKKFRLTVRVVSDAFSPAVDGLVGFEVRVDDVPVTVQGNEVVFPAMQPDDVDYAKKLYSFGIEGSGTADMINFVRTDPIIDPTYDEDDVSMLREYATITVTGYPETMGALIDFPMLVEVSKENIYGFDYRRAGQNGSSIRFTDEHGMLLPHEIETWNPGGTSYVWVKVPYYCYGARIKMHWSDSGSAVIPGNEPKDVWSDYVSVYHFGDAQDGGWRRTVDSTGRSTAVSEGDLEKTSRIGNAGKTTSTMLASEDWSERYDLSGEFTVSGWYKAGGTVNFGTTGSTLVSKRETFDKVAYNQDGNGWAVTAQKTNQIRLYGDGKSTTGIDATLPADMRNEWFHFAISYANGNAEFFANAVRGGSAAMAISECTNDFMLAKAGSSVDELRVSKVRRSSEWIWAECMQAGVSNLVTYGQGSTKDNYNYWVEEPSVTPTAVETERAGDIVCFAGTPRYGVAVMKFYDAAGNELADQPTTPGTYRMISRVPAGVWIALEKAISFVIYDTRAYEELVGFDRVMLFNSDEYAGSPVKLEGYSDVDAATNRVWYHSSRPWTGYGPYVKTGDNHVYYEPNTEREKRLWTFRHARIGNLFMNDDEGDLDPTRNYLPWNTPSARRFDDSKKAANSQRYAGHLILQNRHALGSPYSGSEDPTAAYSPFYEKGIGTVYFDAVNSFCDTVNKLKVQKCVTDAGDLEGEGVAEGEWQDVKADVLKIVNGVVDVERSVFDTTEIFLEMSEGGAAVDSFYRIRALVDSDKPVRVRIVRTDYDDDESEDTPEDDFSLILIDNIIISPPAMGVRISQFGAPAMPGNVAFRGQRAPFDIAFPSVDDLGKIHGQIKVDYISNNSNEVDATFIGAMTMNYRWRYLDQLTDDWKELLLLPSANDPKRFVSTEPIEGLGEGDIEYNARATVNAPFYKYHDYAELPNFEWPIDISERRGDVKVDATEDGVYGPKSDTPLSPALGTNYFIRIREGKSDLQGVRLHVRKAGDTSSEGTAIEMTLVSDNTWRGFYQTLESFSEGVSYRIEAYDRQTATGCDYQWTTNWYRGSDQTKIPANDVLTEGTKANWTTVPCDGVTGYLMFQFEDSSLSLSVIHADYQNFNRWTDAMRYDPDFLGTSQELPTSGVSRAARDFDDNYTEGWYPSVATNVLWQEPFDLTPGQESEYVLNKPFTGRKTTPRGNWYARAGQWVSEQWGGTGKSIAFQMKSDYGSLEFKESMLMRPRGIESMSYSARVAQSHDIHSFNYYADATNSVYTRKNYTFIVPTAMSIFARDGDFNGNGSISAIAYYRETVGGYEVRVERSETNKVVMALYKWHSDGTTSLLGTTQGSKDYVYYDLGLSGRNDTTLDPPIGRLFISCSNQVNGSVMIVAGLRSAASKAGAVSSGNPFWKISYVDSDNPYTSGTFGVGSAGCPAIFVRPALVDKSVTNSDCDKTVSGGTLKYSSQAKNITFGTEKPLIQKEADYAAWNIYEQRLPRKNYEKDAPATPGTYGFKAKAPEQIAQLTINDFDSGENLFIITNIINSFGFITHEIPLRLPQDVTVMLEATGVAGGPDIVFDNLEIRQWRGEDYDNDFSGNAGHFGDITYGAPTNFVYTTGWLDEKLGLELSPLRIPVDVPGGFRSPLFDGSNGRGLGLGSIGFTYRDADRRTRLLVQVMRDVIRGELKSVTENLYGWETVEVIDFSGLTDDQLKNGCYNSYIGEHGVQGVMRVIVDPTVIAEANDESYNPNRDPSYGRIYIMYVNAKDNPELDKGSWWGWNLRTTDDPQKWLLRDGVDDVRADRRGLSYALNNSIEDGCRSDNEYATHKPFLQTPIFVTQGGDGVIGEVSFKARRYTAGDISPTVAIYGTTSVDPGAADAEFEYLDEVVITCDRYENFTFQAPLNKNYTAFRLAVTGVDGIKGDGSEYRPDDPPAGPPPKTGFVRRVLIDEVAVFEAIRARLGFRNVGAFRTHLANTLAIVGMPLKSEQPMAGESWGVQTELYAAQLSEKIDLKTPGREPKVFFHWYEGDWPWGYENWKNKASGNGELARCRDVSNLVYRASYEAAPNAVVTPKSTRGDTVVQFAMEVVFYMEGQDVALTNVLTSSDWVKPYWYDPIDLNASIGNGQFAAYTILDTVAPGWAWLNEFNVFGIEDPVMRRNTDRDCQYVEVAVPAEADLTGWSVRMVTQGNSFTTVTTNTIAVFGEGGLAATKPDLIGSASGMVFRVICCPQAMGNRLHKEDGTADAIWKFANTGGPFGSSPNYMLDYESPVGIQLVRPRGVIEHEIVVIGTNSLYSLGREFRPDEICDYLNKKLPRAKFFVAGSDDGGEDRSLSVWDSRGEVSNFWDRAMLRTPGRINTFADGTPQYLDPDHPRPFGSSVFIYSNLSGLNIEQAGADGKYTTNSQILVIQAGSLKGTDITYRVSNWYELGKVTENNVEVAPERIVRRSDHEWRVNVGRGASNTVYVVAKADVCEQLRKWGIDEHNPYTPAVMDWFKKGCDMYGNKWPDYDKMTAYRASFLHYPVDPEELANPTNYMSITEMYWLDMCPTISNQFFIAGNADVPEEKYLPGKFPGEVITNKELTVFMAISNGLAHATSASTTNTYYAPYVIRGIDPGYTSWDYAHSSATNWYSANFKINGILINGLTDPTKDESWIGLRWFVFDEHSFTTDFTSKIQVADPYSSRSPGWTRGWGDWFKEHGYDSPVWFRGALDVKQLPYHVEILRPENELTE